MRRRDGLQISGEMKAVILMFDSLNRHLLPPYAPGTFVHAPNFQRLAARSVTFDRSYVCSMPCMPARRDFHTGRPGFLHAPWGPLEPFDFSVPRALKQAGVTTHLVTDHYHYFEDSGTGYATQYGSWEFLRGQEGDLVIGQVRDPEIPEHINGKGRRQDWVNRPFFADDARHYQTRTIDQGIDFLERNHAEDHWCLTVECFDPHEPFFCDERYHALYPEEYDGPLFDWPGYREVRETPEQVRHLRNRYAALLSKCDESLGRILDKLDEHALWDETLFAVWTDHGFLLGEHACWAKNWPPLFEEIAHTPFFLWDPRAGVRGERRDALVQPALDLGPTLLDLFGLEAPETMTGRNLAPVVASDEAIREGAIYGYHGKSINFTDGRFVYIRGPVPENQPLFAYTLQAHSTAFRFGGGNFQDYEVTPPNAWANGMRLLQVPVRSGPPNHLGLGEHLLYDLQTDPGQQRPLQDPEVEQRCCLAIARLMQQASAPWEQFERLGIPLPA